jgi:pimeloyl-ACP methyl ester carboxylesterase
MRQSAAKSKKMVDEYSNMKLRHNYVSIDHREGCPQFARLLKTFYIAVDGTLMDKSSRILALKLFLVSALVYAGALVNGRGDVYAQEPVGTFTPAPCMFEGFDLLLTQITGELLGFECGYVIVPERHTEPDGATIRLPVAVRRATDANPRSDPLIIAQGGPGGDAFEAYTLLTPSTRIAAQRDIVIFNQRGTFYAEPQLSCPETKANLAEFLRADSDEGERLYNEAVVACFERLVAEGIDLSAYNSLENAADVPLIARALGYDEYNFYGVSYGTLLALHLMRDHPDGLRSVILDSVVPTNINFIAEIPASEDRVFRAVFTACEVDPVCREQYPDLEERYYALIKKFNDNPILTTIVDPETGESYEMYVDGLGLRGILYQLLYLRWMNVVLPKVIHDIERGDLRYIQAMWALFAFRETVVEGMYYSVICAEDADIDPARLPLESLRPEIATTAIDDLQSYVDRCNRWTVDRLSPEVDDPVISDIPTLLLSGQFDPVTPPAFAETAAATLSNATNLVDPVGSHGIAFFDPCVNEVIQAFLEDPQNPPTSDCLGQAELPPFVPPDAIITPVIAEANSLAQPLLARAGIGALLLIIVLSPFVVWPAAYFIRAITNRPVNISPQNKRLRLVSRLAVLLYGVVALALIIGLVIFIFLSLSNPVYATASAIPPSAAPLMWLPLVLLVLSAIMLALALILWNHASIGSIGGKIYYLIVTLCAIALVFLIISQGIPPPSWWAWPGLN